MNMGKTKIIATIGSSTNTKQKIKELVLKGCDAIRINMRQADYNFCDNVFEMVEEINSELKTSVSIILDTNGPDIRVGLINNNEACLNKDDIVRIYKDEVLGDSTKFSVSYENFVSEVRIGNTITLNDGLVELTVEEKCESYLKCRVVKEGIISSRCEIHVVGIKLDIPFLSEKDKEDIIYAHKKNADFLAVSYVSSSEDILEVNDMLIELGNDHMGIIAKIEKESAIEEIDEIIKVSDGIMIARTDLGVEVPVERIPGIQKSIISKCHIAGKISIVAAELISTMEESIRPTRAEVSDIANAVLDGADAVMLSGETTIGKYPIETLEMVEKVLVSAEKDIDYLGLLDKAARTEKQDITGEISYSVAMLSCRLKCSAIVVPTISGYTARKISRFRPSCPILAISNDFNTVKSLSLNFGIVPILVSEFKNLDTMINESTKLATKKFSLNSKDKIIITGGYPFKEVKHTNFVKIEEI